MFSGASESDREAVQRRQGQAAQDQTAAGGLQGHYLTYLLTVFLGINQIGNQILC